MSGPLYDTSDISTSVEHDLNMMLTLHNDLDSYACVQGMSTVLKFANFLD